ncbi:MAG TPA: hypothetical protein VFE76_08030, partial [Myxococcales bacterium]|nr:hypothetical protein [Myxococcales bacterium]
MNLVLAQLVLALSFAGTVRAAAHGIVDRFQNRSFTVALDFSDDNDDQGPADDQDSDESDDEDLEVIAPVPPVPPAPPRAPAPPAPPVPPTPPTPPVASRDEPDDISTLSEKGRSIPTVDLLHRIARAGGWSLTIVGSP